MNDLTPYVNNKDDVFQFTCREFEILIGMSSSDSFQATLTSISMSECPYKGGKAQEETDYSVWKTAMLPYGQV